MRVFISQKNATPHVAMQPRDYFTFLLRYCSLVTKAAIKVSAFGLTRRKIESTLPCENFFQNIPIPVTNCCIKKHGFLNSATLPALIHNFITVSLVGNEKTECSLRISEIGCILPPLAVRFLNISASFCGRKFKKLSNTSESLISLKKDNI